MAYSDVPEPEKAQQRATAQAERALQQYTLGTTTVRFIQHNAGIVFRVDAADGPFMLKLHQRVGSGSNLASTQLEEGMRWLAGLAHDTGMVVQVPIMNQRGQYVSEVREDDETPISATLQRWLEGQPPRGEFSAAQLRQLGRLTAQLHNHGANHPAHTTTLSLEHDTAALRSNLETLRSMLVPNVLSPARFDMIDQAVERIAAIMRELGTAPEVWGVVHGDIHHDNVLLAGEEIWLIDWTGVRLAHYCYELGVTLYHIFHQEPAMRCALLEGYAEVRSLPNDHVDILEAMIAYAALDSLAWNSTITTQLDAPLFRRNVETFTDGFCASLVAGRSFLLAADYRPLTTDH